jgi:hypothetical protein
VSGGPPGWTSIRHGPTNTPRGRVAQLLHDHDFWETAFNVDFAYDDDEARLFLANDIDRIRQGWTGENEGLRTIEAFLAAGPAK